MSALSNLGFKIFRLMEVKEQDEFLLYDIDKKKYNQYSHKRILSILDSIFFEKGIDYKQIAVDELSYNEKTPKNLILRDWIQMDCVLIDNLGYKPTNDIIFEEEDKKYFNTYKMSNLLKFNVSGKHFNDIKTIILNLVGGNEEEYKYITHWIGWMIQNPLNRLPTSIILQGEHGTGKTKFCELVLKQIFGSNFCEIGQVDINKDHNDFMMGKQLIVANEVIHNDNKLLVPDKLKNYVTDQYVSVNKKFKDTMYLKNYSQWIFVTNNDIPLKIENGDRRYSIFKSKKLKNGREIIDSLLNSHQEQLNAFVYYLRNLEIDFDYVSKPIMNEAKKDVIQLSQNSVEEFIDYIKEIGGFDVFARKLNFHNQNLLINLEDGLGIPTNILYELYSRFCLESGITHRFRRRNFTINLKKLGFNDKVTKVDENSIRVIDISEVTN